MLSNIVGNTPLIKLKSGIYAKLETYNPTGSIKDRVIKYIVNSAILSGKIKRGTVLVEATSGNTGIALSAMGAHIGNEVNIIMPKNMSEERREMMRFFGAKIIDVPDSDFLGAIELRNKMVLDGAWSPMQFENSENIDCHMTTTAVEIYEQTISMGLDWGAFVSGAGTGGTMMGVSRFASKNNLDVKSILMQPFEDPHGIQGVGDGGKYLLDVSIVDRTVEIKTKDAISRAKKISKELGIPVGISSGANVLASESISNKFTRDIVTIICDRGERYLSIY